MQEPNLREQIGRGTMCRSSGRNLAFLTFQLLLLNKVNQIAQEFKAA